MKTEQDHKHVHPEDEDATDVSQSEPTPDAVTEDPEQKTEQAHGHVRPEDGTDASASEPTQDAVTEDPEVKAEHAHEHVRPEDETGASEPTQDAVTVDPEDGTDASASEPIQDAVTEDPAVKTEQAHEHVRPEDGTDASQSEPTQDAVTVDPEASAIVPLETSEESRKAAARKRKEQWPELDEPYPVTIAAQLQAVVPGNYSPKVRDDFTKELLLEYKAMNPSDPLGSSLSRVTIAVRNATMESLGRATESADVPSIRARDLKLGLQGAQTLADLVKVIDARESRGLQNLTVGQVNVQSGGQAIVGSVTQPKSDPESCSTATAPDAVKAEVPDTTKAKMPVTPKVEDDDKSA